MKINIKRIDQDFALEAINENGNSLLMDGSLEIGGNVKGMRPMQLLLSAIGGCSAIDVISILKKQKQQIYSFEIEVEGDRENIESYSLFRKINLHFMLKGKIDPTKAEHAIKLSLKNIVPFPKRWNPLQK